MNKKEEDKLERPYEVHSCCREKFPPSCRELTQNSQPVRNKQIKKTHVKEKQSHAKDNIYAVWQFAYVHGIARISLLSRKNTKYGSIVFPLSQK